VGLAAVGIAASIAMAWTLSVQAQGGATTVAPPRMPPAPTKSSYTPVVEEPFETVFYRPVVVNGRMASADGPIKTFPLRGIKDTPPYLHDGRLLTLDDTVEFFSLVLGIPLTAAEKQDLVAFLRAL
jgi:cytochrome c peroxidase